MHNTSDWRQHCHVGHTSRHCRLGLFQDSHSAGELKDSKSTSERGGEGEGVLCIFGSQTFVLTRWMCKKQTSVSHGSTEAEVFSLDAGLRKDGIPALDLWDLVIEELHSSSKQPRARVSLLRDKHCEKQSNERTKKQSNTSGDLGWTNVALLLKTTKQQSR